MRLLMNNYDDFYVTDFDYVEIDLDKKLKRKIIKSQRFIKDNKEINYVFLYHSPDNMLTKEDKESRERIELPGFKIYSDEIYFTCYIKNSNIMLESEPFKIK